jgi:hypothetical protein
VEGSSAIMNLK